MFQQKDRKSKKSTWKFCLDLTHPVEDGIFDSGNFVSRGFAHTYDAQYNKSLSAVTELQLKSCILSELNHQLFFKILSFKRKILFIACFILVHE